jgi:hypothetical protein
MEKPYVLSFLLFLIEAGAFVYSCSLSVDLEDTLTFYWSRLKAALIVCMLAGLVGLLPWVIQFVEIPAALTQANPVIAFALVAAAVLPVVQAYTYFARKRAAGR